MYGWYSLEILMKSRGKILKLNCVLAYFLHFNYIWSIKMPVFLRRGVSSLNGIAQS